MPKPPLLSLLGLCILGLFPVVSLARSPGQTPASSPTVTLQANSRIVLTDVTVTDRNGNLVHGLPASDFRIFDNNRPQRLASFDEHDDAVSAVIPASSTAAGVYSNDFFQHLPPVLNVLVLDTTNLELPDQMYLGLQLRKFINALPPGQPIAIFERHGDNAVPLQNFTTDHARLLAAVGSALPRIILTGREYRSDTDTLHQIAIALSQVPGRKNVLWFSGGSTSFLLSGLAEITPTSPNASTGSTPSMPSALSAPSITPLGEDIGALRQVYDELEAARIAVYPIDARGLTIEGDAALKYQQTQMNDVAKATGGEAFFNMNGLAQIAGHIVTTDNSTYTLTYSPSDFSYDNKWHTVRVTLKSASYHLSYRRGYFADRPDNYVPGHGAKPATSLLASDSTAAAVPDLRSSPIPFQASVRPATEPAPSSEGEFVPLQTPGPAPKGTTAFAVDYSLSTAALKAVPVDGSPRATLLFAVIAFDRNGERVGQSLDRVRFPLKPASPPQMLKVQQQIDLRKGGAFLTLCVWDAGSGRIGTLQIPLDSNRPESK